jgi:hypothetical protein
MEIDPVDDDPNYHVSNSALDKLSLFASDLEIAIAIVGKQNASHWKRNVLPTLEAKNGFPRYDTLHKGRPVPLVKRYYENYLGLRTDFIVRSAEEVEDWSAWKKRKDDRKARAKAASDAWAERKRKALEEFNAKKAAEPKGK